MEKPPLKLVVVGGGVIGLTTALVLREKLRQPHVITVVSEFSPMDRPFDSNYTSPWAGANFRPFPSRSTTDSYESQLTRDTQSYFRKLERLAPFSSIKFINAIEYLEDPDSYYSEVAEGYSEGIEHFKVIPSESLPQGVTFGTQYQTWVLNPPKYLEYLYNYLTFNGIIFIHRKLESLREVFELYTGNIVFNCTGQGLQYDGGYDDACYSIRGQTLCIEPPLGTEFDTTLTHQSAKGKWTFCIPRPLSNEVIIGGTKQPHNNDTKVDEHDTLQLKKRGEKFFPQFMKIDKQGKKYFDVKYINVGLRPFRKGGFRQELERKDGRIIIHSYGAGGMGYELSYGAALRAYQLFEEVISCPQYRL